MPVTAAMPDHDMPSYNDPRQARFVAEQMRKGQVMTLALQKIITIVGEDSPIGAIALKAIAGKVT